MSKKSKARHGKNHQSHSEIEFAPSISADKRRVYVLLCVGLLVIPIAFTWIPGMDNGSYYMTVILAAILAVALLWAAHKRAIALVYSPFFAFLGVWLGVKLLTTATSILPYQSFLGSYREWTDGFLYAFAIAVFAAVVVNLQLDNKRIVRLIGLISVEAVVFSVITIGQAISQGFFYQKVRPNSPILNADFFISYILLFLPLLIILAFINVRRRKWWRVTIYGVGSLLMLMALFVTLPTHLQTILLPSFEHGKVDTTSGANDTQSITAGNFTQDDSNVERWNEWKYGLQFGLSRPLTGTGPSTTKQDFQSAETHHSIDMRSWNNNVEMSRSHDDFIEQFSQEGLLGLFAYLALWIGFVVIVIKNRRKIEPPLRPFAFGIGTGLLLWFGFNQVLFTTVVAGGIVMVWIGLLLTMVGSARPSPGKQPIRMVAVVCIFLIGTSIWIGKYWVDDARLDAGIQSDNQLESAQASSSDWLNTSKQIAAVANDLPYESYYNEIAAISAIEAYPQPGGANYKATLGDMALHYARIMQSENPDSTEYMDVLGTVEYVVSPSGSAQEQEGIHELDRALSIAPTDAGMYESFAGNAKAKKDYATERKYILEGLSEPLKSADRNQLLKLEASLPPQ